ncbi:MAG: hypothetical protein AABX13_01170 [Nanoarchaeota archaeon]
MRPAQYRAQYQPQPSGIRQRTGEDLESYLERLHLYTAGMMGLLEQYEKETTIERSRQLHPLSMKADQQPSDGVAQQFVSLITQLYQQLTVYQTTFPRLARKSEIRKRARQLESILTSVKLPF